MLEQYDKLVDTLNSVKLSVRGGVVAGGALTWNKMSELLKLYSGPHKDGIKVLMSSLRKPRQELMKNVDQGLHYCKDWEGYNFDTGQFEDYFTAGITDSAEVLQNCLIDSVTASIMLSKVASGVIHISKDDNKQEY